MILLRPVEFDRITQHFGENPQNYKLTKGHNGLDYGIPEGTLIRAAEDGVVIRAELDTQTSKNPKKGYGYNVRIRHPSGSVTIYAHIMPKGFLVKTGDIVKMGDPIAKSGNTGMSTGPHLHFELRTGDGCSAAVDPEPFIVKDIPDRLGIFQIAVTPAGTGLNIRSGPGKEFNVLRSLKAGEVEKVFGIKGETWLQVADGYIMYDSHWVDVKP